MKIKKSVSVLLAMTLIVSMLLSGCGQSSSKEKASDADTGTDTTGGAATGAAADTETVKAADKIIIFQSKVEIADQLEALGKVYTEETGVEVEIWGTTGDDYLQQLKIKLSNNQGPTVFSLAPGSEAEDLKAYLADLSDLSFIGDIAENMAYELLLASRYRRCIPSTSSGRILYHGYDRRGISHRIIRSLCNCW